MKKAVLLLATLALATPAMATPEPKKPVPESFFSGRWYEIARTPNDRQKGCEAPNYQFVPKAAGTLAFIMTCHKGTATGKPSTLDVTLHLPPDDEAHNKFRVTAFGGLLGVDYWVLDRADNGDWWILATPKTPRVWLLSRQANIDPADRAEAMARIKALGFDPAKLEYPKQA